MYIYRLFRNGLLYHAQYAPDTKEILKFRIYTFECGYAEDVTQRYKKDKTQYQELLAYVQMAIMYIAVATK